MPRPLTSLQDLDAALASSSDRPIVIFKHSATCGTSLMAHEEIEDLLASAHLPVAVYKVQVQGGRAVSDAIEARLGVRHESPQVLVIYKGEVKWRASHYRVTADAITAAVRPLLAAPAGTTS